MLSICCEPSIDELSEIRTAIKCTFEGCSKVLSHSAALSMHMAQTHRKRDTPKRDGVMDYHCPVGDCVYNKSSAEHRCFKSLKYLKQHYLKVHAPKTVCCELCSEKFATTAYLNAHLKSCGNDIRCSCGVQFKAYESLQTHARRFNHAFGVTLMKPLVVREMKKEKKSPVRILSPPNVNLQHAILSQCSPSGDGFPATEATDHSSYAYNDSSVYPLRISGSSGHTETDQRNVVLQIPVALNMEAAIALTELSLVAKVHQKTISTQTDNKSSSVCKRVYRKGSSPGRAERKKSAETQTAGVVRSRTRKSKASAETQTVIDGVKSPRVNRKRKLSMQTQTLRTPVKRVRKKNHRNATTSTSEDSSSQESVPVSMSTLFEKDATWESSRCDSEVRVELSDSGTSFPFSANAIEDNFMNLLNSVDTQTDFANCVFGSEASFENVSSCLCQSEAACLSELCNFSSPGPSGTATDSSNVTLFNSQTQTDLGFKDVFVSTFFDESSQDEFAVVSTMETQTSDELWSCENEEFIFSNLDLLPTASVETQTPGCVSGQSVSLTGDNFDEDTEAAIEKIVMDIFTQT